MRAEDKPKHHTENGFRNYPLIEPADTKGFKFIWNRISSSSKPDEIPANHLIDEKRAIDRYKELVNEDTITWIGQSTALLKINGKVILTDPFFSKRTGPGILGPSRSVPPGISADNLPAVDIIVISHNHYDHLDADFFESLPNKEGIEVIVPLGIGEFFRDKDYIRIYELDWHQTATVEGLKFTSHPMVHYSVAVFSIKTRLFGVLGQFSLPKRNYFLLGILPIHPLFFRK